MQKRESVRTLVSFGKRKDSDDHESVSKRHNPCLTYMLKKLDSMKSLSNHEVTT